LSAASVEANQCTLLGRGAQIGNNHVAVRVDLKMHAAAAAVFDHKAAAGRWYYADILRVRARNKRAGHGQRKGGQTKNRHDEIP
jgi:hypothetical protein